MQRGSELRQLGWEERSGVGLGGTIGWKDRTRRAVGLQGVWPHVLSHGRLRVRSGSRSP